MTSLGLIRIQLPLFIVLTITTLLLSWVIIHPYGLVGAAWICVASSALQFILSSIILYIGMEKKIDI